jgi:biopolymer transport protein ExbD
MQFRPHKRKRSVVINVTSLIDVMFNLLLFFMVSTTFLSTPAIKLELPKAKHAEVIEQRPIVVYLDSDGTVYLNDEPVNVSLLGAALEGKLSDADDRSVVLKADSRVSHGTVVEVMDAIKGAGATRLVISTEPAK